MNRIDFVIPWVDGSDPAWHSAFRAARCGESSARTAAPSDGEDASAARYRDWGTLRYWFRSIDRFAPWVHRIHFITWGHLPAWLNVDEPRLHIVRHSDYLPEAYRPCFNSNTLELNLHRLPGLAEQFVLFNDDTFLGRPAEPTDFFRGGLPRDMACLTLPALEPIAHTILNNLMLINRRYRPHSVIARHPGRWLLPRYGVDKWLKTLLLLPWSNFAGIRDHHMPQAFLLRSFRQAWEVWGPQLDATCRHPFRTTDDLSQWLVRYDTLCRGDFRPINFNDCRQYTLDPQHFEPLRQALTAQRHRMFCLHDNNDLSDSDFNDLSRRLQTAFDTLLPDPSPFELPGR